MKNYLKYGIMGVIALAISGILFKPQPSKEVVAVSPRSYEEIVQSGTLRAVTEYNSISFHVQEDTINGLHYELLHAFANEK
jgi:membrane-bound lytic murein transglycosylase MltF